MRPLLPLVALAFDDAAGIPSFDFPGRVALGVVLLVAAGSQKPAHLAGAIERLELVEARLLGVILNRAGEELRSAGGYYAYQPAGDRFEEPAPPPPVETT